MKLFEKKDTPQLITIGILILVLLLIMDKKNKIYKDIIEKGKEIKIPEIEHKNLLIPDDNVNISNLSESIKNSIGMTQTNVYA